MDLQTQVTQGDLHFATGWEILKLDPVAENNNAAINRTRGFRLSR